MTGRGSRNPVGATWTPAGTNFSVFSRRAKSVELLLYPDARAPEPARIIPLDPRRNVSFYFWHVFVPDVAPGTHYNWRVALDDGNGALTSHELLDPCARAVCDAGWDRGERIANPAGRLKLRAALADTGFDWDTDPHPPPGGAVHAGLAGAVIYELHVGGFTRHPSAGVRHPGTFLGLIEKIPYLQSLGITHVQLLPVAAFDEQDVPPGVAARGLKNYWGYSPHSFCSPHPGYAVARDAASQVDEFRTLVQALHRAGLKVILDVVLNHTAEGGADGPVLNYKGLAPDFFYHRDGERYRDYTGTGNTVNCNDPLVTHALVTALERWVEEMHVDGFRFDLASVFARGEDGAPMQNPPLPWAIEFSRTLAEVPLIAEAWDAAGLYHVGRFPGLAWSEWNGRYRDVLRKFWRGDAGMAGELATCLAGSSDLYLGSGRLTTASINFVTCHDGFTLADLVSYREKHNEANGEDNRDGWDHNLSWNCGVEGPTTDPAILGERQLHARNLVALLFLSQGVPMLLAGDEVLRTQGGNNNAWCQDNETSWFDWRLVEANREMLDFVRGMIALRRRHPSLAQPHFLTGAVLEGRGIPDIRWHGRRLGEPPWEAGGPAEPLLAFTLAGLDGSEEDLHVVINGGRAAVELPLPEIPGRRWHRAVATAADGSFVHGREHQPPVGAGTVRVEPASVAVFEAR